MKITARNKLQSKILNTVHKYCAVLCTTCVLVAQAIQIVLIQRFCCIYYPCCVFIIFYKKICTLDFNFDRIKEYNKNYTISNR